MVAARLSPQTAIPAFMAESSWFTLRCYFLVIQNPEIYYFNFILIIRHEIV